MIVRILGEGQFELPESTKARLDELDAVVERAVAANDEAAFRPALWGLLTVIREEGTPLDPTRIVPSDLAVPGADASLHEVHELLASEATADN